MKRTRWQTRTYLSKLSKPVETHGAYEISVKEKEQSLSLL